MDQVPDQPQQNLVNVVDPDTQEVGSISADQLPLAMQQGFSHATPDQVDNYFKQEKYGSTSQQIAAGAEGAASAATFGLSTGLERAAGVPAEDINARREVNPSTYGVGQGAGLVGSLFIPGAGEANLGKAGIAGGIEAAGNIGVRAAGLGAAEGTLAKIGSSAVRAGVENAVFQGGDEVSKMLASDPNQSVETAAADIGLSGLVGFGVGGGLGAVSPLWKATLGGKVGSILDTLKNKAGGIDGTIDDAVHNATQTLGLDLGPEAKASLSNDPWIQSAAKGLQQTDTTATGRGFQERLGEFKTKVNDSLLDAFGKTAEDLPAVQDLSQAEYGKTVGETLAKEVDQKINPIAQEFEDLKTKYKDVDLIPDSVQDVPRSDPNNLTSVSTDQVQVPGTASKLVDKVAQLANDQGWTSFADSQIMGLVNKVMKNLPEQTSLKNLSDFTSQVGKEANKDAMNFELKRAGQMIKGILQEGESDVVMGALGKEGPELVDRYSAARSAWRDASKVVNSVDDRLKIGGSTSSFARNIREMAGTDGEALVRRLSGKGDADMLRVLQEQFPETAAAVQKYHMDSVLKKAADKARPGEALNPKALIGAIDGMSPELRNFAIPAEVQQKAQAVSTILEQLDKAPHNHSNTARTLDKITEFIPGTAVGMATMLAGGNPAMGFALGALTKYISKDAPDAVRMALLKFMATGQPIEAGAFKATVDMIQQTIKGENAVNSSVRQVFKSSREVLPSAKNQVSDNDRQKLDKRIKDLENDPSKMLAIGGESAYYLPQHATAMAETSGRVMQYLRSVRPSTDKKSPLDPTPVLSPVQKAAYDRALDIAEKPLMVLNDVRDGSVTSKDLVALRSMYPSLYSKISQKLTEQMISATAKEEAIPYHTKMGLSLFLGQPLDSTMTPASIMASQLGAQTQGEQQQQAQNSGGRQGSVQKLGKKIPSMAASPDQARAMNQTS